MQKKILLKNAKAIVTCDEKDTVYQGADMLIEGSKIIAIGKDLDMPYDEVVDAAGHFVYPGMVNTHHHFFHSHHHRSLIYHSSME